MGSVTVGVRGRDKKERKDRETYGIVGARHCVKWTDCLGELVEDVVIGVIFFLHQDAQLSLVLRARISASDVSHSHQPLSTAQPCQAMETGGD